MDRTEQLERGRSSTIPDDHSRNPFRSLSLEEREMEQSLAALAGSTSLSAPSTTTDESVPGERSSDDVSTPFVVVGSTDDVMDLLRAIEMSRLQAVRETELNVHRPSMNHNVNSLVSSNDKIDYFNDLQQAIELSLTIKPDPSSNQEAAGAIDTLSAPLARSPRCSSLCPT